MVFDPAAGEVYVALEGDCSKIFRVSLDAKVIETYSGFDEHASWPLNSWGISMTELQGGKPGLLERIRGFFAR